MRELGRVCRDKKIFPTSFQLDAGSIEIPKLPFASGNFGDVYHGTLDGKTICVKRLKLYAGTDSKIRGVSYWRCCSFCVFTSGYHRNSTERP